MKSMKLALSAIAIMCAGYIAVPVAFAGPSKYEASKPAKPNIVGVATSNKDFSTLVSAVKAAELVSTLASDGPFTVFAPTNEAFAKVPEATLNSLLQPENKEALTDVLTYHVVAGKVMAADLIQLIKENGGCTKFETVNGGKLQAKVMDGNVFLIDENGNKSKVTVTDVKASNGVVHVIDTVVLPK